MHIQSIRVIPNIIEQTAPIFFANSRTAHKISDAVDYEQSYSREYKIGEKHIRKRQLLEIGSIASIPISPPLGSTSIVTAPTAPMPIKRPEY